MFTVQELYQYASRVRRSFAQKLAELPWDEVKKNREASLHSMRNILIHMIDNEDWIVNWVIQNRSQDYVRGKKSDDYSDMKMILDHLDEVEKKTKAYFAKADEVELGRRTDFILSSGDRFDLSVEECLFQAITEQLFHMGELIALLWQQDIRPPNMQWFWNNPREMTPHL